MNSKCRNNLIEQRVHMELKDPRSHYVSGAPSHHVATGYVLINVEPGHEFQVHKTIAEIEMIEDATILFGEYDVIAKIVAEELHDIASLVVESIRQIPGVVNTKTLAGAERTI